MGVKVLQDVFVEAVSLAYLALDAVTVNGMAEKVLGCGDQHTVTWL